MTAQHKPDVRDAVRRYATIWTVYGGVAGGGDFVDGDVLWRRWADADFTIWNRLFVPPDASSWDAVERSLAVAADYLRRQSRYGTIAVARKQLSMLPPARVAALGLLERAVLVEMEGMVSQMPPAPASTLRFERVTTMEMLEAYADINADAYGLSREGARAGIAVAPGTMMLGAFSYIGFEGDRMMSAASVLPHEGRLYLGLVATRPEAGRRGFASQTIRHALQVAHYETGLDRTDLHATVTGAPVYAKLGYRPIIEFALLQLDDVRAWTSPNRSEDAIQGRHGHHRAAQRRVAVQH